MVLDYSKWNNLNVTDSDYDSQSDSCEEFEESHSLCCNEGCPHFASKEMPKKPVTPMKKNKQAKKLNFSMDQLSIHAHEDPNYSSLAVATKPLMLPSSYKGSPTQRIHYMEAWKVHRKYFEQRPFLKFDPQIQIHNSDTVASIHPILFTDPFKFVPKSNSNGELTTWGLSEIYDDFFSLHMRRMTSQYLYNESKNKDAVEYDPAVQFVNCLAHRKEIEIIKYRASRKIIPMDYILDISLRDITPKVWRRISLSSSMKLHLLQDKVLCPVLGLVRNYHGYYFTDARDGSQFGPSSCNAVDFIHLALNGFSLIDDSKFSIRDILRKKNDVMYFTHDLGDHFEHIIRLIEIKPPESYKGKVEILDGQMAPFPEDSLASPEFRGNMGYQALLDQWQKSSPKKKQKLSEHVVEAMNYYHKHAFDPFHFDLQQIQKDLKRAFNSRLSLKSGSKKIIHEKLPATSKRVGNVREVITPVYNNKAIKECVSVVRDSKTNSLCYQCGKPDDLKSCGNCRMVWYCSEDCQKNHWETHQTKCKKYEPKKPPAFIKKSPMPTKSKSTIEYDENDELPELIPLVEIPKVKREGKNLKKKAEVKKVPFSKIGAMALAPMPMTLVNDNNLEQWRADFEAQIEIIQRKGHA